MQFFGINKNERDCLHCAIPLNPLDNLLRQDEPLNVVKVFFGLAFPQAQLLPVLVSLHFEPGFPQSAFGQQVTLY